MGFVGNSLQFASYLLPPLTESDMSFIGIALRVAAYDFSEKEDDGMHFAETALRADTHSVATSSETITGPRRHRTSSSIFPQVYGVGYLVMFRKYCISNGNFICLTLAPEQLLLRMHPYRATIHHTHRD